MSKAYVFFTDSYACTVTPIQRRLETGEAVQTWESKIEMLPELLCLWLSNSFEKDTFEAFRSDEDVEKFLKEIKEMEVLK
mgnify:CR=1 FL=1